MTQPASPHFEGAPTWARELFNRIRKICSVLPPMYTGMIAGALLYFLLRPIESWQAVSYDAIRFIQLFTPNADPVLPPENAGTAFGKGVGSLLVSMYLGGLAATLIAFFYHKSLYGREQWRSIWRYVRTAPPGRLEHDAAEFYIWLVHKLRILRRFSVGALVGALVLFAFAPLSWAQNVSYLIGKFFSLQTLMMWGREAALSDSQAYRLDLVTLGIILCFFGFMFKYLYRAAEIHSNIVGGLAFLRWKFAGGRTIESFSDVNALDTYFKKSEFLARSWVEFRTTIIYNNDDPRLPPIYSTNTNFSGFDEYELIESNMLNQFWSALPGMFTAAGIFNTFCGLVVTLGQMAVNSQSARTEAGAMPGLITSLAGMHMAFYASVFGVGAYILFTLTERAMNSMLIKSVSELQSFFNSLVTHVPEHHFLSRAVELLNEQRQLLKKHPAEGNGGPGNFSESRAASSPASHERTKQLPVSPRVNISGDLSRLLGDVISPLRAAAKRAAEMKKTFSPDLDALSESAEQLRDESQTAIADIHRWNSVLDTALNRVGAVLKRFHVLVEADAERKSAAAGLSPGNLEEFCTAVAEAATEAQFNLVDALAACGTPQPGVQKYSHELLDCLGKCRRDLLRVQECTGMALTEIFEYYRANLAVSHEWSGEGIPVNTEADMQQLCRNRSNAVKAAGNSIRKVHSSLRNIAGKASQLAERLD